MLTVYLAPEGFAHELKRELERLNATIMAEREHLFLCEGEALSVHWAQNIWHDARFMDIASIGDAARKLTAVQRNWHLYSVAEHRRAALIQEALPHVGARPLHFGDPAPSAPLGSWTLWERDRLLAAPCCSSPFADGKVRFVENRVDPPSRAYLKLWEVFTLLGTGPKPGELCLDLGAAPGGWTWVLASMGARVFSVDKAPLAANVAAMPTVDACTGSGFGLDPRHAGRVDWVFSDMICYPERLYGLVERWLEHDACRNMVCTLKFQAETDDISIERFAAVPHSRLVHLSCNRHELTWIYGETLSKDGGTGAADPDPVYSGTTH